MNYHDLDSVEKLKDEISRLKNENDLFRLILDHISEGVQVSSESEIMLYYNHACEKIEGVDRDKCLGRSIKEIYSKTNSTKENSLHRVVRRTGVPAINVYNQYNTNKHLTEVFSSTYSFDLECNFSGVFSILREAAPAKKYLDDITLLKQREKFLRPPDHSKTNSYVFEDIIYQSEAMHSCINYAKKIAPTPANIMLYGETGSGKELFSQSIHNASLYSKGPFVAINCAAIPDNLLESMLFGTEKGSFSGALSQKGLLEQAADGTFFLDELNSMPLTLQAKILRAIEMRSCRRLGGNSDIKISCRFICSTNVDPQELLNQDTIRKDLYYRLSTVIIHIPALRERPDDIVSLCNSFIKSANEHYNTNVKEIDSELIKLYKSYQWPGNIRELKHDIDSCILLSNTNIITKEVIPDYLYKKYIKGNEHLFISEKNTSKITAISHAEPQSMNLKAMLDNVEKEIIKNTLIRCGNNITLAAKTLGIHRQALQYRLRKTDPIS